jgi:hypothetical protein
VKSATSYWRARSPGESAAWGKAEAEVDVSAARVLAYMWHYMSYESTKPKVTNDLLYMAVDVPNSHSMFQLIEVTIPLATNRVFACKWTWRREASGDFVVALTSLQDLPWSAEKTRLSGLINRHKDAKKTVLGVLRGGYRITRITANVCRVRVIGQSILGGSIPDRVMNALVKSSLDRVKIIQDKCVREPEAKRAQRAQRRVLLWREEASDRARSKRAQRRSVLLWREGASERARAQRK